MSYVVSDNKANPNTLRWSVVDDGNNYVDSYFATRSNALARRDVLNAGNTHRSELLAWQQDVLIPALLEKEEEHDWCDEFEEFLESLGLERPKAPLPTGKYASVLLKGGDYDGYLVVRIGDNDWYIAEAYETTDDNYVNRYYDRTVFAGES